MFFHIRQILNCGVMVKKNGFPSGTDRRILSGYSPASPCFVIFILAGLRSALGFSVFKSLANLFNILIYIDM